MKKNSSGLHEGRADQKRERERNPLRTRGGIHVRAREPVVCTAHHGYGGDKKGLRLEFDSIKSGRLGMVGGGGGRGR